MYRDMLDLSGKVALITGASRGIGEAISLALSEFGARVVLSSRKLEGLNQVKEEIEKRGGEASSIPAHMGNIEALEELVNQAVGTWGRLDILVNNAATNPVFGPVMDADAAAWDKIMDVNLKGMFFLTRAAASHMAGEGKGSIINISTEAAFRPAPGLGMYSISKAGVEMLTKAFAQELGSRGVRVNAIAPGLVQTRFSQALWANEGIRQVAESRIPLGRIGQPHEIAGLAVFLASDASSFMTGETILVDGGAMLN